MKIRTFRTLLCFILVLLCALLLIACKKDTPTTATTDKSELVVDESKIGMTVSAEADRINITLSSDSKEVGSGSADIIALKAFEYLEGDRFSGLSQQIISLTDASARKVGVYHLGTDEIVSIDRLMPSGYDNLYNKYYVIYEGKIVKGPIYTTDIAALYSDIPTLNIRSKKGLFADHNSLSVYKDLGASHTVINLTIETLIYPNEIIEDGVSIPIDHPDDAIAFVSNGVTYYFNRDLVESYDELIGKYYDLGAQITAIILARPNTNEETFPQSMTYPHSTEGTSLMSLNTSNRLGFAYYIALMEFMADRYTKNNFENGYISNFVIGNEIDYAKDYNRISEKQAPIDVYMEEYSRLMRLANLATRKYSADITVSMPLTHAWATKGYSLPGDAVQAYAPKQLVEWLNTKTKMEGDYAWGIAPHIYGYHLAQAGVFYLDTLKSNGSGISGGRDVGITGDYNTTSQLTFTNLEVLDDYLHQSNMMFDGAVRPVYLTESGVSSHWNSQDYGDGLTVQAATIATAYYKISQLDSIVSFSYYRAFDNEIEAGDHAMFGLLTLGQEAKPAYNVYKYIDTQYSSFVADKYLSSLQYFDKNQKLMTYGTDFSSYTQLLNLFGTEHDFSEFDWKKATPVTADTVYEYEDKIDLSSISFPDRSFLYDGLNHSLAITGTLPEGVTVTYSDNNRLADTGKEKVTATFTKDGEVVGRRVATLEVTKLYTNKKVYALGEKIFVTAFLDTGLDKNAWIGIYRGTPTVFDEDHPSLFWYYVNTNGDGLLRTVCLQEQEDNLRGSITPGEYTLYYFADGGYGILYSTTITVLPTTRIPDDLTGIGFESDSILYDGASHSLAYTGTLPDGVTVEYENNGKTEVGTYQVIARFLRDGVVIESRYAVLTIEEDTTDRLVLDKTQYEVGEDIFVTATAFANADAKTWWVGLYLKGDSVEADESIFWYYVKDDEHTNGAAYNIRQQSHNTSRSDYVTLPAGQYKMVLFNTGGYTVQQIIEFEIVPSTVEEKGTIDTDKDIYTVGEDIFITATCPDKIGAGVYWVGLYLRTDSPETDNSIYWYYVKDASHVSGTAYNIKEQSSSSRADYLNLPAGEYTVILFNSGGYTIEVSKNFTIKEAASATDPDITVSKTEFAVGEAVNVTATVPTDGKYYWVGLYLADDDPNAVKSILWYEVSDATGNAWKCIPSGTAVNIKNCTQNHERSDYFDLPAGEYKLILFNSDGYTIEKTIHFTVTGA